MSEVINGVKWEKVESSEHGNLPVVIGGIPATVADMTANWPHVEGEALPFFGTVTSRDAVGDIVLFLGSVDSESWKAEGGANCAYVDGQEWPEWVEFEPVDEPVLFCENAYAADVDFVEPNWLQGDETPEGYTFIAEIPSQIDGGEEINIGDGYGTAYVFASEDGKSARLLWQS